MLAIIDYGVGNLFSLTSSFKYIGVNAQATSDPSIIRCADHIILPGVGAFRDAISKLNGSGLGDLVREMASSGRPVMGICLGMQLLLNKSYEYGEYNGLGLIDGSVRPIADVIDPGLKIPQIGWNALSFTGNGKSGAGRGIYKYTNEGDHVYFVHSYYCADCGDAVTATCEYSAPLTASIEKDNVYGCQFHPEKSGDVGLNILKAFCEL